jgi:hypothetical protein
MNWLDARVARMEWTDIALLKICVAAFTLMIAKLWPVVLTPHWAIFVFLFLLAYAPLKQVQIGMLTEKLMAKQPLHEAPIGGVSNWLAARIANLNALDIGLLKVSVLIITLLAAKLWPALLTPDWRIFGGIFLVTYVPLMIKLVIKRDGHA